MFNPTAFLKKWLKTSTPRQKLTAGLLIFSLLATGALFALSSASETASDPLGSTPLYFAGVFIKLLGVLLLIVGSAVLFRRWTQFGPTGKTARQLRLLETVRLSPKQALHLVMIGDQQLLIGATDQSIALITHVEASKIPTPVDTPATQPALDFSLVLQSIKG
jgi:flagellar biosynthetic protein FliO